MAPAIRAVMADSVELKADGAHSLPVHLAKAQILNDQSLAVGNVDLIGLPYGQSVEKYVAAKAGDVAVLLLIPFIVPETLGYKQ